MEYFILGGTGFVGNFLIKYLLDKGEKVTALVRDESKLRIKSPALKAIKGDPLKQGEWQNSLNQADIIVNLVGSPVMTNWTEKAKKNILSSRVDSTANIVASIKNTDTKTFICANAVGYYGPRGDEIINDNATPGSGFLADVGVQWQETAMGAENFGHRVAIARFSAVLGPNGGALAQMLPIFKLGLGGKLGSGNQWFSWVHILDLIRAVQFISHNETIKGPVNLCSPKPVTNIQFTKALSRVLKRPAFFMVPGFGLKLMYGEVANMLLTGQRCIPQKLIDEGFTFEFEEIEPALADIVKHWT